MLFDQAAEGPAAAQSHALVQGELVEGALAVGPHLFQGAATHSDDFRRLVVLASRLTASQDASVTDPTPDAATAATVAPASSAAPGRFGGLGAGYWKLWTASVVSNLGDGISAVAYPWLATVLTRDPLLIAGVGVATRLPWLLFSLPAGVYVDRSDRRRLMVACNASRFAVTAVVSLAVLFEVMNLPLLYVTAILLGIAEVLYDNASQTILPSVVPAERLERANGNLWGAELVMNQFVGPPLGGFLIAVGLALPFGIDAVTFAVSAALIAVLAGSFRPRAAETEATAARSLRGEMVEGMRWLWSHRLLRTLAITLGIMNGMGMAVFAIEVLFVQEILLLDARGFGFLFIAGAVGGVLGSQLAPLVTKGIGPGPSLYLCLVAGGVTLGVNGLTSNPWVFGAMFVIFSFTAVIWNVITVSLRQTVIPDRLLGRVNSVYRFFGWGSMPIGSFLGGLLVTVGTALAGREFGLRLPFFVAAAVHFATLAAVGSRLSTGQIEAARAAASRP